jgi:hypothetical protein
LACTIHCVLMPPLLVLLPALSFSEKLEPLGFGLTLLFGSVSFWSGRASRTPVLLLLVFLTGLVFWGASLAQLLEPWPEQFTSAAGSMTAALALLGRARFQRHAGCPVHGEETLVSAGVDEIARAS